MRRVWKSCFWALLACGLAASAAAQTWTATIHGKVASEQGAPLGGAKITAVGTASGFVATVNAGPDGTFQLGGLTPGEYTIVVSAPGHEERSETLTVLVGKNLSLTL